MLKKVQRNQSSNEGLTCSVLKLFVFNIKFNKNREKDQWDRGENFYLEIEPRKYRNLVGMKFQLYEINKS